ncbi:MAG: BatA domain-containing protein [Candidatus Binatia bacterium]
MDFLNPAALYGLLALPLLLVPYLIRRKPPRVVFSSLLLLTELRSRAIGRPWGRLRLPAIFFLQLLMLLLLILALSEPVLSVRPSKIAMVLDNSASMQALESDKTRFGLAQRRAMSIISELGATATVDLYLTVPRLEKLQGPTLSPAEAAAAITALAPYDMADAAQDYGVLFDQMSRSQNYDRIYFITDHPARGQGGAVRVITVGQPKANLAVSTFEVGRSSMVNSRLQAQIEVTNFSSRDARVKVALKGGRRTLSTRELVVPAGRRAQTIFEGFPAQSYYAAEIATNDALPLDNRRFALPPPTQTLRILAVSPRPQSLASLRSIPGVNLNVISPTDYASIERTGYGLEIFHFSTPAALPASPALFILPPNTNPLVELGQPVSRSVISSWREPHSLTRYVNFALFRPPYARTLKLQAPGEVILQTPEGPLSFAAERNGIRYLVLGFDPFPYLGRDNLPVSIFTLNFLDWFFEGRRSPSKITGESLNFPTTRPGDQMLTPKGQTLKLSTGSTAFPATFYQGVYAVNRGGQTEHSTVNLQTSKESDLREAAPVELAGLNSGENSVAVFHSFWPYLLMATLLLLLAEWFVSSPARRFGLRRRTTEIPRL